MERATRRAIIDYVLANTKPAAFRKAVKNYNFTPLVETHRDHLLNTYFGGDGVKYSAALPTLWEEHITEEQAKAAQKADLDLKAIKRKGGTEKDQRAAEKELANNTGGLRLLVERFEKENGLVDDEGDEEENDDDDSDEDTINKDRDNGAAPTADTVVVTNESTAAVTPGPAANQEPSEDVGVPGDGKVEAKAAAEGQPTPEAEVTKPGQAPKAPKVTKATDEGKKTE